MVNFLLLRSQKPPIDQAEFCARLHLTLQQAQQCMVARMMRLLERWKRIECTVLGLEASFNHNF